MIVSRSSTPRVPAIVEAGCSTHSSIGVWSGSNPKNCDDPLLQIYFVHYPVCIRAESDAVMVLILSHLQRVCRKRIFRKIFDDVAGFPR